jgi:uncharacterized protein (TIGR02452 family)
MEWDAIKWAQTYKTSNLNRRKELLIDVWENTIKIVKNGKYFSDGEVIIDNSKVCQNSLFTENGPIYDPTGINDFKTEILVMDADCLDVARTMENPIVLNMASYKNPGGGVINGSSAQEENLFRRTNLFKSLYQYVDYAHQYGIEQNSKYKYPLGDYGAIYSKDITVFRGSEKNGYYLLSHPFKCAFISVPAIKRPELKNRRMNENDFSKTKQKIRRIFQFAHENGHRDLVLSAFGCGAYGNPPEQIASIFKELLDTEYKGVFHKIVFAIYDDHNSYKEHNPDGNLKPFKKIFNI